MGGRVLAFAIVCRLTAVVLGAADAIPVLVRSAPGRFEVSAIDAMVAHAVVSVAEECWRHLEVPLALPAAFSSPIFVRLTPAGNAAAAGEPYQVNVEPGGVVSVWLRADFGSEGVLRRALVHGLLSRLAVARHGASVQPTVPRWLEQACLGWWLTRAEPAQLDALKQRAAGMTPPGIAGLLDWPRDGVERPEFATNAVWLLTFLQVESGRAGEWGTMLRRLFAGDDPQAVLATSYPGRFHGTEARELWWQTGWHHARRMRALPVLEAAESRVQLGALARFVFAAPEGDGDVVVPLRTVLGRRSEALVGAEVARRATELRHLIPSLHPFYRNAGLSLAEGFGPVTKGRENSAALCASFEQDWRDALEIEAATNAALDALERGSARPGAPGAG